MSLELHVEGVLGARLFSEVVGLIAIVFIERKTFLLPFNSDMAIKAFRFSLPLIPSGIIGWIFLFGDRYFISTYLNTQTVGVYGFMITIVSLISLFSDAITHGIQPYLFRYFKESNIQTAQKTNLIAKWYLQAVLLFSFLILLGGFNLNLIIKNTSYLQFQNYLIGGVLVFILDAYTKLFTNRVLFYKKTTFISGISIFSIFITTCLYGGTGKTGRRP
jgi:O-antigen/teichoic acid export membrane protein